MSRARPNGLSPSEHICCSWFRTAWSCVGLLKSGVKKNKSVTGIFFKKVPFLAIHCFGVSLQLTLMRTLENKFIHMI